MTDTGLHTLTFAGKVALIAGASRGIGAVTARAFARAGASVVLAARDGGAGARHPYRCRRRRVGRAARTADGE